MQCDGDLFALKLSDVKHKDKIKCHVKNCEKKLRGNESEQFFYCTSCNALSENEPLLAYCTKCVTMQYLRYQMQEKTKNHQFYERLAIDEDVEPTARHASGNLDIALGLTED